MNERKQALSTTVDRRTLEVLDRIAAREADRNRSEAFRRIVAEAGAARGMCPAPTAQSVTVETAR